MHRPIAAFSLFVSFILLAPVVVNQLSVFSDVKNGIFLPQIFLPPFRIVKKEAGIFVAGTLFHHGEDRSSHRMVARAWFGSGNHALATVATWTNRTAIHRTMPSRNAVRPGLRHEG
jgi:hypothetical protein